ncbi:MAG: S8/S53 family peptidase [Rhodanobacteraceae bacterium]|nr:S8/S53 family peptidase [Rhodanobacteraceae bacterium]
MYEDLTVTASTSLALAASARGKEILTPRDLCRDRGLSLARVAQGAVYFDSLLGYAILRSEDAGVLRSRQRRFDKKASSTNFGLKITRSRLKSEGLEKLDPGEVLLNDDSRPARNWRIRDLGNWPEQLTGRSQRVAVMDSGIAFGFDALPRRRDHADFCSCNWINACTHDLDDHGTKCAGVIGARVAVGSERRSVAPDADVIAAQVAKIDYENYTTLADLLLMLSWVIHRWKVRVVSMSFCAAIRNQGADGQDVLGIVAGRLRQFDRALIFCAAEEQGYGKHIQLSYPASADQVVPVGEYLVDRDTLANQQASLITDSVSTVGIWAARDDLLLGPGSNLTTIDDQGREDNDFSDPSGACAFVAGVAVLYMEAFPCRSVEQILAAMKADARRFTTPATCVQRWPAIRFPPDRRACWLCEMFGPLVRAILRGGHRLWHWFFGGLS